ncbi:uncharacterized protein HMPREF1541_00947 [Cyphellophora europaea CBS 101466]|uniref:FAD-binding domain-containing protein n=1 Tax=Cyphellophora europaea (strain CBS 101466) TaxID=1220924 RepID=W2SFE2_CYPE1|nr:uncharacterized protein HMPREF1541_00947 [Cyphellophora europaea CBS 101466]ETN46758.1 hypothetical protein HMPREF1541_00947 [Cyphellophora europaea CBS 101466]
MKDLNVIVVGAGIGGLQTALALAERGFKVTVLEAVQEFTEVGAGIRVPPNSNLLSKSWGVDFGQISKNVSCGNRFVDWKGKPLLDIPFEQDLVSKYGAPYYFLHRADLMNLLLETAQSKPNIEVRFGCKVVRYDFETTSVQLENGQTVQSDLIVCADGIKSAIRDLINGEPCPPLDTGDVAYRILVPAAPLLEDPKMSHLVTEAWATHWIGPSAHAVGYPLRGGELYNIIIDITHETDPSPPLSFSDWMQKHSNTELLQRFSDWCPEVKAILSLTGTYLKWKLADFDQLKTWVHPSNRAVLLGDSCHPMMPYLAQGAAQATEDAACLAACLSHFSSLGAALKQYQQQRKPRAAYIARNTRVLQEWWHVHDGPLKDKRDQLMGSTDEDNPMFWGCSKRRDWLFGHDASTIGEPRSVADGIPDLPPEVKPEDSVYQRARHELSTNP